MQYMTRICDFASSAGYVLFHYIIYMTVLAFHFRKVQQESATGSTSSNKVRTVLAISVELIDFDIQACALRVKGRNVEENQYVKVSTLEIIYFTISKMFLKHLG